MLCYCLLAPGLIKGGAGRGSRNSGESGCTDNLDFKFSKERFEIILSSISDGVFAVDQDWRIACFNRAAEETLGFTREEVLGRPCHEVLQSNICRGACALRYTMETGNPIMNLAVHFQDALNRRVPVTISTAVLEEKDGRIIGGVATFRNLNKVKQLLEETEKTHPFDDFVTSDPQIKHIFEILPTLARSESSILVYGETGTGKNLMAKAIHNLSDRRDGPFVTVNCGAMPETLLESELFGYKAGAFTGANRDRIGRITAAAGGTLFLDEIGDLPLSMQVKLLRFLQDHVFERLGDVKSQTADVRIVTATNRNLLHMVEAGEFRQDLYYRINVLRIEIPPLRDRLGDIPQLVQRFLEKLSMLRGKPVTGITREVLDLLMDHNYPGNVRELENIIEHAFVLCPGNTIEVDHLPDHILSQELAATHSRAKNLAELESNFLVSVLEKNRWSRQDTAKELGIHKTTLLRKIRRLGIALPKIDGRSHRRKNEPGPAKPRSRRRSSTSTG